METCRPRKAPRWVTRLLYGHAQRVMRRDPDMFIGGRNNPYMLRWYAPKTPLGGMYIHRIMRSDDDRALHDHPFPSLSIVLHGVLLETYAPAGPDSKNDPATYRRRWLSEGDVLYRSSRFAHRLSVGEDAALPEHSVVTAFMIGPDLKDWGFFPPHRPFVPWRDFVSNTPGESVYKDSVS